MRYRALLRVILLVWVHVTFVSAAPRYQHPAELGELLQRFITEGHQVFPPITHAAFLQGGSWRTTAQLLVLEEFLRIAGGILGIAYTAKKVSARPKLSSPF